MLFCGQIKENQYFMCTFCRSPYRCTESDSSVLSLVRRSLSCCRKTKWHHEHLVSLTTPSLNEMKLPFYNIIVCHCTCQWNVSLPCSDETNITGYTLYKKYCSSNERKWEIYKSQRSMTFTREDPLMMSVSCLTSWLVLVMTLLVCCCVECLKEREKGTERESERGEETGNHALQTAEDDSKWLINYPKVQCSPGWASFTALLDG